MGYPEPRKGTKTGKVSKSSRKKQADRLKAVKERQKNQNRREEILRSPTKLYKYRNEFTKQEIDEAMKRFEWEKKLSEFSNYEMNAGKRYVDTLVGYVDTGINVYNKYSSVRKIVEKER